MDDGFREQDPSHGKGDPSMGETLTIEEIEARYAPFWVLIGEPETDDQQHLLGGRVLWTSTNSEELYLKATELGLDRIAVRYLGTWPDDLALVL
jgi:hypothetical protein